jgi:hypothetical protein
VTKKELRLRYDPVDAHHIKRPIDSIVVYPSSRGILRLVSGLRRDERVPHYVVRITADDKGLVTWEEETLRGQTGESYVIVHIFNLNDSKVFATLVERA